MDAFAFRSAYYDHLPTERGSYPGLWLKAVGPLPDTLDVGATLALRVRHAAAVTPFSEAPAARFYGSMLDGAYVRVEEIDGERVRVEWPGPRPASVDQPFGLYFYGVASYQTPRFSARATQRRPYAW